MEKEQLVSLVTKAQQGDNEALNSLFNEFYNDLYYFALKTVKDDETALDVTQEAFVEIINTLGNLKEPAAFVTWAKQITYHQCTRYFKKKKDVLVDEDEDGNTVFDTLKEENAEFIPDEALDKADFKKTVMAILDELSEEQRSATMMYYFDEMSVRQIAEIQGISEGTVKSRLNYARKAIKNSVEEYEKKHNIKLHAIPFFPFFRWLFEGAFEGGMPTASAEIVAEGVTAATGTTVTVATATATTATVATTATTAGAVGLGAKIAALPLATKIIAGVVAAAIAIGGGTTAVILSQKDKNEPIIAPIDYSYFVSDIKSWDYEEALSHYDSWAISFDMPYFDSVDEVSVDEAVRFGFNNWTGYSGWEKENTSLVGEQKVLLNAIFGRDFDLTKLTGEYATYNAKDGIVDVKVTEDKEYNNAFSPTIDNGDGTYSRKIYIYNDKIDGPIENAREHEYIHDVQTDEYYRLSKCGLLTIEQKNGFWVLKSYIQIDPLGDSDSSTNTTTSEDSSTNNSTSENSASNNSTTDNTLSSNISSTNMSSTENVSSDVKTETTENTNPLSVLEDAIDLYGTAFNFLPPSMFEGTASLTIDNATMYLFSFLTQTFTYQCEIVDETWEAYTIPLTDMNLYSKYIFGVNYDFTTLNGDIYKGADWFSAVTLNVVYDSSSDSLICKREKDSIYLNGEAFVNTGKTLNEDGSYTVTYAYGTVYDTKHSSGVPWYETVDGKYIEGKTTFTVILENIDDSWVMTSFDNPEF